MHDDRPWHDYDYALIRVVPNVHLGTFVNVGVVLHARTARFLGAGIVTDPERLAALCPALDTELLVRFLTAYECICRGGPDAGAIGREAPSDRFHWLTAPRSAVLQTSELHSGRTRDPQATLDRLFAELTT